MQKYYVLIIALFITFFSFDSQADTAPAIAWKTWSDKNFEEAQKENRFVILDLEAVWCHWCHVMDKETYANPQVIRLIQTHFIPVKVDQDSRPDLSNRYQDYGWPATVIYNAHAQELRILRGYVPPERMIAILESVIVHSPNSAINVKTTDNETYSRYPYLSQVQRQALIEKQLSYYDKHNKGWGGQNGGQKYLDADVVEYAMYNAKNGDSNAKQMAMETLAAQRALLDPVWGGMYQYSTGGDWKTPHFEKIMSVQTDNIIIYTQAYRLWHDKNYLETAQKIDDFLTHFLMSPEGVFYTSQDADVIKGEHTASYFKLDDAQRRKAGIPQIDKNIYARENGWAINALAYLYMATGQTNYLTQAKHAAEWIINHRSLPGGGFRHSTQDPSGPYLGDTLAMGKAFLSLYQITAERHYLILSINAADFINQHFKNLSGKPGFITAVPAGKQVLSRVQPDRDENAALARFANMIFRYTGNTRYKAMAENAMRYICTPDVANSDYPAPVLLADNEMTTEPLHLTVAGLKRDMQAKVLYQTALAYPSDYKKIEWWDKEEGLLPYSDIEYPPLTQAAVFICLDNRCSLPIFHAQDLAPRIEHLTQPLYAIPPAAQSPEKSSQLLTNKNVFLFMAGFLFLGLLLAFTPCVLPMLPILGSIIVGQGQYLNKRKAFFLSLTYVGAMSLTYALAGVIAGFAGSYIQAYLQNPWVLISFSFIFVLLALSLFGVYELRMPHLTGTKYPQKGGSYIGVAVMGCLATLIGSPCITAPLLGVLTYIGHTGDVWIGGSALFLMGIGMGIPLLIIAVVGGSFLPKGGPWLNGIKILFGLLLLGTAIFLLDRILPGTVTMLLWALLAVITSVYMGIYSMPKNRIEQISKAVSFSVLLYGWLLVIGAFMGNTDPLRPLQFQSPKSGGKAINKNPSFKEITNLSDLQAALSQAKMHRQPVMIDFYADWCISCKEIVKNIFPDPAVKNLLSQFVLIKADITRSTPEEMALAKYFNVIAPPAFLFFDRQGNKLNVQFTGEQNARAFSHLLQETLSQA
jgi:thiol:disulfide interchange protein